MTTKKATPARASSKPVVAATPKPTSYPDAAVALRAARSAYDTAQEANRNRAARRSEVARELRDAVRDEDFVKAEALKKERTLLESDDAVRADLKEKADAVSNAVTLATDLFFEENPDFSHPHAAPVTLTRVTVVDPQTMNSNDVVYIDSGDTVQLSLSGRHFESEAYHLSDWAVQKGFLVKWNAVEVNV